MATFKSINKKLDALLKEVSSKKNMEKVAKFAAEQIQRRTRVGKGVDKSDGPFNKLRPLAKSTIAARKRKKKAKGLSGKTSVSKSNLTETGKMLESLDGIGVKDGLGRVFFKGHHSDGLTNSELADIHENQGASRKKVKRHFFHLAKSEINAVKRLIRNNVKEIIDKKFD